MALFTDLGKDYTKTDGKNLLTRASHFLSYIPFVGSAAVLWTGGIGTVLDAGKWLFRGKILSAVTTLLAGAAETFVNSLGSFIPGSGLIKSFFTPLNMAKAGSGLATGESLGAHARKAVEATMGGLSGLVGAKPQVLSSYTAGIGSIGAPAAPGPGRFVSQVAASKGEDPNAAYARLQSGQADHLAALEAAQNQPNYRSV